MESEKDQMLSFHQGSFSALQHLLQLSYSEDVTQQQRAACDLARLVEGTVFPAVSFGPLSHALCRLIPSQNRTIASYAVKAVKLLILDDALRPQAISIGVPTILSAALLHWMDEPLCLREILGALQTLCWDKQCVRGILNTETISCIIECIKSSDIEVSILATAAIANILSYSDTILLTINNEIVECLVSSLPLLIEYLRASQHRPQRFYSCAAIANASYHPRLAAVLVQNGALQLCRDVERQSLANLHILGSRMGQCAQTAVFRLSDKKEGDPKLGITKYNFKWGNKPIMELSLASFSKHSSTLWFCFIVWLLIVLFTFLPVFGM